MAKQSIQPIIDQETGEVRAYRRDSFVWYRTFEETASLLPQEQRMEFYTMIIDYALDGKEPDEDSPVRAHFPQIKLLLDKNAEKALNGNLGGRPKKKDSSEVDEHSAEFQAGYARGILDMENDSSKSS